MSVDFLTRVAMVGLSAYAAISTAAAMAVWVAWRRAAGFGAAEAPRQIARRLFAMRLAPAAAGFAAAVTVVAAFVLLEPNPHREVVGLAITVPALFGAVLAGLSAARMGATFVAAVRLARRWRAHPAVRFDGCPIEIVRADTPFPVVALMGLVRPRLIVASSVIEACTPAEMEAAIAHEMAHLASRDNLRRAMLAACPDVLAGTRVARAMERAWHEATELAADDRASGGVASRRLDLASALVKVSRLAVGVTAPPLPASALFRGEPVADRVRRLLAPPPAAARPARWIAPALAALAMLAAILVPASLPGLYEVVEAAVRLGR